MLSVERARILIVEDDPMLLEALDEALSPSYATVRATTGREALDVAGREHIDLLVLDLNLPDMDGLDVARYLSGETGAPFGILMLTARADVANRVAGLYAGASDYVAKPFDMDELLARVHAQLRRSAATVAVARGGLVLSLADQVCTVDGVDVPLSASEAKLLALLLTNQGRVFSRAELEVQLYRNEAPASNAVEALVSRLRARLADVGMRGVVETVRGLGYVVRPQQS